MRQAWRAGCRVLEGRAGTEGRGLGLDWGERKNVCFPDMLTHPQTPRLTPQPESELCLLISERT